MARKGMLVRVIADTDVGLSNALDQVSEMVIAGGKNCTGDVATATYDFEVFEATDKATVFDVARFALTEQDGKAVQEVLNRYVGEELRPRLHANNSFAGVDDDEDFQLTKDIDYIEGLAKLFD